MILPSLAAVAALVLLWWIVYATGFFDPTLLPSPASVWDALVESFRDGSMMTAIWKSLIRLAFGLGIAIIVGTLLGMAMAARGWVQRSVGSLVFGLQSLPSIAWLPLAILWFGLKERAIVFVVIIGSFPAIALATASSIREVPPLLIRAGRTIGASGWTLYRRVVLPSAVPGYLAGLQLGWAFAWRSLMAGELIATGAQGLGHLLDGAQQQFDTATVMAVMVVIVVIGMVVDMGFSSLSHRVRRRRGILQPSAAEV